MRTFVKAGGIKLVSAIWSIDGNNNYTDAEVELDVVFPSKKIGKAFLSMITKDRGLTVMYFTESPFTCRMTVNIKSLEITLATLGDKIAFPKKDISLRVVRNWETVFHSPNVNLKNSLTPQENELLSQIAPFMYMQPNVPQVNDVRANGSIFARLRGKLLSR